MKGKIKKSFEFSPHSKNPKESSKAGKIPLSAFPNLYLLSLSNSIHIYDCLFSLTLSFLGYVIHHITISLSQEKKDWY